MILVSMVSVEFIPGLSNKRCVVSVLATHLSATSSLNDISASPKGRHNMKRRSRFHTPEEIQKHLSSQKNGGLSVGAYCTRANIAMSTFWNWRKRYPLKHPEPTLVNFYRLPATTVSPMPMFEIHFANNTRLKVPCGFDSDSLKTLISVLR